jgi:hypothetical protein
MKHRKDHNPVLFFAKIKRIRKTLDGYPANVSMYDGKSHFLMRANASALTSP